MPTDNYFGNEDIAVQGIIGSSGLAKANAGEVGELITATLATGSAVSLTTATSANVTSIALTPGDWDVWGVVDFNPAASTSITKLVAALSLTTNTLSTQPGGAGLGTDPLEQWAQAAAVNNGIITMFPQATVLIYAATTLYLVAQGTFTVSTLAAYGTINARRRR